MDRRNLGWKVISLSPICQPPGEREIGDELVSEAGAEDSDRRIVVIDFLCEST